MSNYRHPALRMAPMEHGLVIKRLEVDAITSSGIHLVAKKTDDGIASGKIIAAGPGTYRYFTNPPIFVKNPYSVGDRVVFKSYSGVQISEGEVHYTLCTADDVIGFLLPDPVVVTPPATEGYFQDNGDGTATYAPYCPPTEDTEVTIG